MEWTVKLVARRFSRLLFGEVGLPGSGRFPVLRGLLSGSASQVPPGFALSRGFRARKNMQASRSARITLRSAEIVTISA